jgi:GABA permease
MGATPQLRQGLSQRQLMMIAIGGIIGAGFFVGSGVVIGKAGPAAFLTYALCGVLIILVMRMLGEMATANPSTGSFAEYARQALGGWAGFSVGWLYWYYWVIVVGFEAVAGGEGHHLLVPRPFVAALADVDAADDGDESVLRRILWRVRILVRRNQSRRPSSSSCSSARCTHWGYGRIGTPTFPTCTPTAGSSPTARTVFGAVVVVIFSMVGAEVATIAAAETPIRSARFSGRRTRWPPVSRFSLWARSFC